MRVPTMRVKNPAGGFMTINESDYDLKVHEVYRPSQSLEDAPKARPAPIVTPTPSDASNRSGDASTDVVEDAPSAPSAERVKKVKKSKRERLDN